MEAADWLSVYSSSPARYWHLLLVSWKWPDTQLAKGLVLIFGVYLQP